MGGGEAAGEEESPGGRAQHVTAIVTVPVYKVSPAVRASHLACARTSRADLQTPSIQRVAPRADGADMGRAMVARLGLGLLLLALLLPTQIYCNQTSAEPFPGNQTVSVAPNPTNATTRAGGSSLQSTAGFLALSLSLLHLYC